MARLLLLCAAFALAGAAHFGNPYKGPCQPDELIVQIQGIAGAICTPRCTGFQCPTDLPDGCTANPQCALRDPSGRQFCALICDPSAAQDSCGAGASCKAIQTTGICTYNPQGTLGNQATAVLSLARDE
eukprot:EG_transcript_33575